MRTQYQQKNHVIYNCNGCNIFCLTGFYPEIGLNGNGASCQQWLYMFTKTFWPWILCGELAHTPNYGPHSSEIRLTRGRKRLCILNYLRFIWRQTWQPRVRDRETEHKGPVEASFRVHDTMLSLIWIRYSVRLIRLRSLRVAHICGLTLVAVRPAKNVIFCCSLLLLVKRERLAGPW